MTARITYLELSSIEEEGNSHKFYEVTVEECEVRIRFGRIGDPGRNQNKTYATPEKALKEADKKIQEKLHKGYQQAVMGVRTKRPITRRQIGSTPSTAKRSPILWRFESGSPAFGIFIDGNYCWLGNQEGRVFKLDHQGQVLNQYKLPEGVKCIVADDVWIYVGCDDGNVYDLTGKLPRLAYEIDQQVDIFWLDIYDGILGVSDANGGLSKINPEGEIEWTRLSSGQSGWMVRGDERGFYHGHSTGVTLYEYQQGRQIWHQSTQGGILFGWQEQEIVYAGASNKKIYAVSKATGENHSVYLCDASVYSCATATDGAYVFAGDSSSSIYPSFVTFRNKQVVQELNHPEE